MCFHIWVNRLSDVQIFADVSDRLVADRRARKRRCSSSLVGMNKTCSEFLGPGMIVNQDETSEESKIKEKLRAFDETAQCSVQDGLTIQAQSSVEWVLLFLLEL